MTLPPALSLKATAIACGLSLSLGGIAGWKLHDAFVHQPHLSADREAVLKAERAARAQESRGAAIATEVRERHDTAQAAVRTVTETIIKEVPGYVSSTVKCPAAPASGAAPAAPERAVIADVSVGFGLLHDAAAAGRAPLPPAAGVDLDAPRGAGMPATAGTVVRNYGRCLAWRTESASWRDWYRREADAWAVK